MEPQTHQFRMHTTKYGPSMLVLSGPRNQLVCCQGTQPLSLYLMMTSLSRRNTTLLSPTLRFPLPTLLIAMKTMSWVLTLMNCTASYWSIWLNQFSSKGAKMLWNQYVFVYYAPWVIVHHYIRKLMAHLPATNVLDFCTSQRSQTTKVSPAVTICIDTCESTVSTLPLCTHICIATTYIRHGMTWSCKC